MSTGQHALQTFRTFCCIPGILFKPLVATGWRHTLAGNTLHAAGYAGPASVFRRRAAVILRFR
jgi:hypothetical protein